MKTRNFPTSYPHRKRHFGRFIIAGIFIAILTFLGVKMTTLDTSVSVVSTYRLPELPDATILGDDISNDLLVIAVDGEIVRINNAEDPQQTPRPIASTAKTILALAVMQQKPFKQGEAGETIKISEEYYQLYEDYLAKNGSTTAVAIDEEISEYDALASVLIASSNNLADILALWAFGSFDNYRNFAEEMLKSWGIEDTTIGPDASGYNENTVSTAGSLAKIGYHLLENPVLAEIVGKESHTVPVAGTLTNTNSLLGEHGISGIKTGYNGVSGYCLVLGYREGTHIITTALLGADTRTESFIDSENLVEFAQKILQIIPIVKNGEALGRLESWWNSDAEIIAASSFENIVWAEPENSADLSRTALTLTLNNKNYEIPVEIQNFKESPSIWQRFLRALNLI